MEKIVKLSYEEFCDIKKNRYSSQIIKYYICKHLKCSMYEVEDFDFNYKLSFSVWLLDKTCNVCNKYGLDSCPYNIPKSNKFDTETECCEIFEFPK